VPNTRCIRSTSGTGTTAAPVTASRSVDSSAPGRSSMVWKIVGGPGMTVIRSLATTSAARFASNVACGTIVAPVSRQTRMPAL
jgi:hypothetical protein